jgi:diaminohydroxyphosphoribosylaminopyrimidine deaminase / 5-amino-6-(5-phosphoribosylamino)uracil reductase
MQGNDDIKFMRRCLELAGKAEGLTFPNPVVGSVIVNNGKIVGEGYHLKSGGPHAEVIAINSVRDKEVLKYSSLYVNLEPCSHTGKTPPCSDLIASVKIPRVVIGTIDTSDKVSGEGISILKKSGCEIITGVLEVECRELNKRFFTFHEKKRPYIILKWAQSADGFLDIKRSNKTETDPRWISGKPERILVHKWRASEQAILIGAGTLRMDHPQLNVRLWKGINPVRLFLSGSGLVGNESFINQMNDKDIVFTHNTQSVTGPAMKVKLNHNETSASQIVKHLYNMGLQSVLIEGGALVLNHFISLGFWDEARIFYGNSNFGDGVKAPDISGNVYSKTSFSMCSLEMISNKDG